MTNTTIPIVFDDFLACGLTGTGPYTITPDETESIVIASTTTATAVNSEIIFENIHFPTYDPFSIYFGYVNVEATLEDILAGFNSQPAPSITFACFGTIITNNTISYVNFVTSATGTVTDGLAHPSGQSISFKLIETNLGYELYAKVTADSTYRHLTSDIVLNAPNGVKPVLVGLYIGGFTTPITAIDFGSVLVDPITPANPIGKRYLVNGAGTYQNQTAQVGNVVEFIDINDIFITEDIEDINEGISSVVVSLQQDIAAIPVTEGVLTNTTIQANLDSVYSFVTVSEVPTEMVTVNYTSIPTPYVDFFSLQIRREISENYDLLLRVDFPAGTIDYNPDDYVFHIGASTNGGYDSPKYRFDIMNISSMLFRCTNGMIEYLGYKEAGNTEFISELPNGGHEIILYADTSSTTYSVANYSDVKHVILINNTAGLVDSIVIDTTPIALGTTNLPQVVDKGIKISIIPGSGTFSNISIQGHLLFSSTPAAANSYHYYIYYPKHNLLVADATNP